MKPTFTSLSLALSFASLTGSMAQAQPPLDIHWTEIPAPYTRVQDSNFGRTIAFDGHRIVITSIGAQRVDSFHWDGSTATFEASATASASDISGFPDNVALDGDRIVATSHAANPGVFEFTFASGAWTQAVVLTEPDPIIGDPGITGLALQGTRLAVGVGYWNTARGFASLVRQSGALSWTTTNETRVLGTVDYGIYGNQVLIDGDQLLVTALRDTVAGAQNGSVTLYRDTGSALTTIIRIPNPSPGTDNQFGTDIAMDATHIYVGCRYDDLGGNNAGAVYVFDHAGARLQTIMGTAESRLGAGLEVDGTWMVADAPYNGSIGQIHVYRPDTTGTWVHRNTVMSLDGAANTSFASIAMSGNVVIAGDLESAVGGATNAGRAWVGVMTEPNGGTCAADSECTNGHCVSGICCNTGCGGACDVCGTGTCTTMACPDAGTMSIVDAGLDAAASPDTGVDSGPLPDSGAHADAAGATDAGARADATLVGDAGGSPRIPLSCTCRASGPSVSRLAMLAMGLLLVGMRARRR